MGSVSCALGLPPSIHPHSLSFIILNLVYLPVQSILAVTVPENEGDCPCIARRSSFAINPRAVRGVRDRWDSMFEKTVRIDICGATVVSGPYIHTSTLLISSTSWLMGPADANEEYSSREASIYAVRSS